MPPTDLTAPTEVEPIAREAWRSAGLPSPSGLLGPASAPLVRQIIASFDRGDPAPQVVSRAVHADAEMRYLLLSGHRVTGSLRRVGGSADGANSELGGLLTQLGIWAGGRGGRPWDDSERSGRIQMLVERLAAAGTLVLRSGPTRYCPHCRTSRSPERTVYQERIGDTYLVRFPLIGSPNSGDLLAWVDAPWRLLGTTAILVNPDLDYVEAEYHRDGSKAKLILSKSSVARLDQWLPGTQFELLRELKGRGLAGAPYQHPLRHEFPRLAELEAPAGTVRAAVDVGDSGTGVVPLVPCHGGSDQMVADRLGIPGLSLLNSDGLLDPSLGHKFTGMDYASASEFVLRDLAESGSLVARLRVLRGVPYCGVCGRPVLWVPGRAWRLEIGRLPATVSQRYAALLPDDPPIHQLALTPWPVSESPPHDGPEGVRLTECDRCDRLGPPEEAADCSCGGHRATIARALVPEFEGALAAWASRDGEETDSETVVYLPDRRRAPSLVHQLVALAALETDPGELAVRLVPTAPEGALEPLRDEHGSDAVRAALIAVGPSHPSAAAFADRVRQERQRFRRLIGLARSLRSELAGVRARPAAEPPSPLDRAIAATLTQAEIDAKQAFDQGRWADGYAALVRFVDVDLERYLLLVRPAPGESASVSDHAAADLLRELVRWIAPIAPFTAEAVHLLLAPGTAALFAGAPLDEGPPALEGESALRWREWGTVLRALDRYRAELGLARNVPLPRAAVVVDEEAVGRRLRADLPALEKAARVARLEVGTPEHPWSGKLQRIVPVEAEVSKAYPSIAPQVVHLLRRLPPRGASGGDPLRDVSVVVAGLPRPIPPHMLTVADELPTGTVRREFPLGELFVQPPPAAPTEPRPDWSPDAAWLLRIARRRLNGWVHPGTLASRDVRIHAGGALGAELGSRTPAIARSLGVASVEVTDAPEAGRAPSRVRGRGSGGQRWSVDLLGEVRATAPRRAHAGAGRAKAFLAPAPEAAALQADYLDATFLEREAALRALADQLDAALGVAAIGPAKAAVAYDAGFTTYAALAAAPFDKVESWAGFGRPVALTLFEKLGRPIHEDRAVSSPVAPPASTPVDDRQSVSDLATPRPGTAPWAPVGSNAASPAPVELSPVTPSWPSHDPGSLVRSGVGPGVRPTALPPSVGGAAPVRTDPLGRPARAGVELGGYSSLAAAALPFLEATASGHRGLVVVREAYDRMRFLVGQRPVRLRRLAAAAAPETFPSSDLAALAAALEKEIEEDGATAVFFEGVDFLVQTHGIDTVVDWLHRLDELGRARGVHLWVHLPERQLLLEQAARLRREFPAESSSTLRP